MHFANCRYVRELAEMEQEEEPPEKVKHRWSKADGPLFFDMGQGEFRVRFQRHDQRTYSLLEYLRFMDS